MKALIQLGVEVADQAEADAAADRAVNALEVPCFARSAGVVETSFTVVGTIRGKPDEPWTEIVSAIDQAHAEERVLEADPKRVVAAVFRGELQTEAEAAKVETA